MKKLISALFIIGLIGSAWAQGGVIKADSMAGLPREMRRTAAQAEQEMAAKKVVIPPSIPEVGSSNTDYQPKRFQDKGDDVKGAVTVAAAIAQEKQGRAIVSAASAQLAHPHHGWPWYAFAFMGLAGFGAAYGFVRWANAKLPDQLTKRKLSSEFSETTFKQSNLL